jgi:hypothetical protein
MSGASITSGTIPASSVTGTAVDCTTNQTIYGTKTFNTAPVMSGASITSGTIPASSVTGTAVDCSTTQEITGTKTFTKTVKALTFEATSDYRIKENVLNLINDSSFTVDNLRPITYTNKLSGKQDIGLIAHELQEQYPFLVSGEKDGAETQSVNYIGLIGILIKEIKELKERMESVESSF